MQNVAQEGMLQKYNFFEVVFYPGTDKRRKRIPGQVSIVLLRVGSVVDDPAPPTRTRYVARVFPADAAR